jgi:hypothetical protein
MSELRLNAEEQETTLKSQKEELEALKKAQMTCIIRSNN